MAEIHTHTDLTPGMQLLNRLDDNKLAPNIMHFGRVLRAAGLPLGPGKIIDATNAVMAVGIQNRSDFYWALHAVFVNRRDQHELFDQAFHIFWKDPKLLERMMGMLLPQAIDDNTPPPSEQPLRRIQEALSQPQDDKSEEESLEEEEVELDAAMTMSARELLQTRDFEEMSAEEIDAAKRAIARMRLPITKVSTRRFKFSRRQARIDMRNTLRSALRSGGSSILLRYRQRRTRTPPLVILCDISGSMSRYTRMFLHFMHAATNDRDRVHTFLFGTRLTNVTRYLRNRDIDLATEQVTEAVEDWSGGTRIGESLSDFNKFWSRRVLGQGAVVILISDGLDRAAGRGLHIEMDRLHKSCRRLIWLNPLLRFDGFQPKSHGIQAILPSVDEFRPVHNLVSLEELIDALNRPGGPRKQGVQEWLKEI
ncbi:MAG: VWA domain-containing protein [Pseudomonadota bacterium]|nr:VWA domain-containing protein [Pseudomonadota bacterium]